MSYALDQRLLDSFRLGGFGGDGYTKSMLHFDGANESTNILDTATMQLWTPSGNAKLSTAQQKFGPSSLALDGSGDYISKEDSDDWFFDTGDFTVEMWVYLNSAPSDFYVWAGQHIDLNNYWMFYQQGSSYLSFNSKLGGTTKAFYYAGSDAPVGVGAWTHIAVVRDGITIRLFKNGTLKSATASTAVGTNALPNLAAPLIIGARIFTGNADRFVNGYIDEFRLSKGIARWTSSFTVPTSPYN